jgi:uncharacterized protein YbbK (DUF523 family)
MGHRPGILRLAKLRGLLTLVAMGSPARRPVFVSACLLGRECRYDGRSNRDRALEDELESRGEIAVPFCPEEHGELGTPRPAAWIETSAASAVLDGSERVMTEAGVDVTQAFLRGALGALETCQRFGIRRAYLKERSPSCGVCQTHAGGSLVDGPGITTLVLQREGIDCHGVEGRRAAVSDTPV